MTGLWEINDNGEKTIEDIMDTRILEKTIPLSQCSNGKATVTIRAWFTPKLYDEDENEIFLEAPKETEKKVLSAEFNDRAVSWGRAIKELCPRAFKKVNRRGGFTWKALDERLVEHFLPEYIAPMGVTCCTRCLSVLLSAYLLLRFFSCICCLSIAFCVSDSLCTLLTLCYVPC